MRHIGVVRRRDCVRASRRIISRGRVGVARFEYDDWGNILSSTSSIPALARNRYRFQGREWSAATGLTNFRARWYDSVTGRWLSKDPIGLSGGLNLYAFCDNNPIGSRDPFGQRGRKQKDDDNHEEDGNGILDSDVGGVVKDIVDVMADVVGTKNGSPIVSTALSTANAVASGAEAIPGVAAVTSAYGGMKQIGNMADPSGAMASSEDSLNTLADIEKNVRTNLRNFNNLK